MNFFHMLTPLIFCLNTAIAKDKHVSLTLENVEQQALISSYDRKIVDSEIAAAESKAEIQQSLLYPTLSLEGSYKYITEVPTLQFPGGSTLAFGDNQNYSIGPTLTWNLLDFGSTKNSAASAQALKTSKEAEKRLIGRQTLLKVRLVYFKIQLRAEQQRLIADSLKLAESQYRDIQSRKKIGSASQIDLLAAHKEVLNLKLQSRQLQADFSSDLRDLLAIIDRIKSDIPSPQGIDSIQKSLSVFSKYESLQADAIDLEQHPLIKMHSANIDSLRLLSKSVSANQLPKVNVFLKTSIDYPNGPVLESIHQNTIGLNLRMPLYEGGRISSEAAEKKNLAIASEYRLEQARVDIYRDWQKVKDQLKGLYEQRRLYAESVKESSERAKLVYGAYLAGRSNFFEVQTANLHALETKVQSATNDIQTLIQLAYLASFSEESLNE